MSATNILWGQIAVIFAVELITMWAATQWTAWRLGARELLNKSENERSGVLSEEANVRLPRGTRLRRFSFAGLLVLLASGACTLD
jgi:hypothetical protein